MIIINEEEKYREQKESIRMVNSQRDDVEKGKKIGINEVIKRNEIINKSLRP